MESRRRDRKGKVAGSSSVQSQQDLREHYSLVQEIEALLPVIQLHRYARLPGLALDIKIIAIFIRMLKHAACSCPPLQEQFEARSSTEVSARGRGLWQIAFVMAVDSRAKPG